MLKILLLNSVFSLSINLFAQPYQQDKPALVSHLFTLQKIEAQARKMVNTMIGVVKKQKPSVPESYWQQLGQQINTKPFIQNLKLVYERNYSVEQLQKLIQYYQKPGGGPPVTHSSKMEQEIYQVGNQFGKETGRFISQKLKQDGY